MTDKAPTKHSICPNCKRHFAYDPRAEPVWLPFCCERCQWIDLGRWLNEEYRLSKGILASDDEQID